MGFGFDFMFNIFPIVFMIMFVLIFGIFIVSIVRGVSRWNKNNHSPVLDVPATVVSKRMDVRRHHHNGANDMHHTSTSSTYYVTFQFASGDRMELSMAGSEYGLIAEGDHGTLRFQGTRFLSFERM